MEDWKTYKLSDFIAINPVVKLKVNEKYSFIEMKDLDANLKTVKPSDFKTLKGGAKFQNGDTLFARITPCLQNGKICQAKDLQNNVGFGSTEFLIFRGIKEVSDSNFIYYLSREPFVRQFAEANMIGTSGRQRVAKDAFKNLVLELPPLKEQIAIASILSALDDKIELNLQMNKTLEEMAMALYKHWFVEFGPFQNGKFVDSDLGMIPEGWEVKSIGEVVKIIGGYAFKSKDFSEVGEKVIKIKNISNNVVSIIGSDCVPQVVAEKTNSKFSIKAGAYLVAMTGAEVGKVGIVPDYHQRIWLNQRVGMIAEPKFKFADNLIGNYLQSQECYEIIQNLAYGSAQPNISSSGLEGILICLPVDISIITAFLENLKSWDDMKVDNYSENQTLTTLRETLLPKLISGEVRVKDIDQLVEVSL
ncbi:restriction endonuclease subunit S [Flavobacterium ardleyense]|uniref:restriction endonuclease subunit S n=1 Tax=Flavobacterium ardleyense TaxID=2038737 RepID=UPI00298C69E6|nr:restriction endonuclease subunit S [Flavobacterium ardleyense]